jgi:hypothetical protein
MPGFVKIGKTFIEDVGVRLQQLYTTGHYWRAIPV